MPPDKQNKEDWEATCIIYSELPTNATQDDGHQEWRYSIILPLEGPKVTFGRPNHQRNKAMPDYRFWTLPSEQYPIVQVEFTFRNDDTSKVQVSLSTPYPATWPCVEREWIEWMTTEAQKRWEERISYVVCEWVEHHALDYFGIAYERDGFSLVLFDDAGPTYYDVDSIVMRIDHSVHLVRYLRNGQTKPTTSRELWPLPKEAKEGEIHPFIVDDWKAWMPRPCPICLETFLTNQMEMISCSHVFCRHCLSKYLEVKVEEIYTHRDNPFRCPLPECRLGLKVIGCVKQYLSPDKMERVRCWYKDLKYPKCHALPQCLSKRCHESATGDDAATTMRKEAIDSTTVWCDACQGRWCEWCLKKIPSNDIHRDKECDAGLCIQFCQRYLAASTEAQAKCEAKWPWIKVYAKARIDNDSCLWWIKKNNGQVCPVCKMGVERDEGCFHIHCSCGAHFCYECGEELFYPFYGTHHCWERG